MSPRHVVVVPSAPALLPGYAGIEDPRLELRAAARAAVGWLVAEHPGDERDGRPGHCSPLMARCGGRRPAIDRTMSTTCRVSTTSCTR